MREWPVEALRVVATAFRAALQLLLAVLAAPLPEAWRRGFEERIGLSPDSVGLASGLLQLLTFACLGWWGFFAWMKATMAGVKTMEGSALLFLNPLLPFIYVLTTPVGFLAAVGAAGGLIRTIAAAGPRVNLADPTLALVETLRRLLQKRSARRARERSIGERSRDLIEHAQADEAWDLRIVSCEAYDWHVGAGVNALGVNWTLVAVRDITDAEGRLRIAYELRLPSGAEVVRGLSGYRPSQPPRVIGKARERERRAAVEERTSLPLSPKDEGSSR